MQIRLSLNKPYLLLFGNWFLLFRSHFRLLLYLLPALLLRLLFFLILNLEKRNVIHDEKKLYTFSGKQTILSAGLHSLPFCRGGGQPY